MREMELAFCGGKTFLFLIIIQIFVFCILVLTVVIIAGKTRKIKWKCLDAQEILRCFALDREGKMGGIGK